MRCPRCYVGSLVLQNDGAIYLCKHCRYMMNNTTAQFVTAEEFTEVRNNMRITRRTVQKSQSLKGTKKLQKSLAVEDIKLKQLEMHYNSCLRHLRKFISPDKHITSIWKRISASVISAYQYLRTLSSEHPSAISSVQRSFVINIIDESTLNGATAPATMSNILSLFTHAGALAIATFLFAMELAGKPVMISSFLIYLRNISSFVKCPSMRLVSSCYRILPFIALSQPVRSKLLFDIRAALMQFASMCIVFQGYKLDSAFLNLWVEFSMHLAALFPQPLCGFHAFIPGTSQVPIKSFSLSIHNPSKYISILLCLAHIALILAHSPAKLLEYVGPPLSSRDMMMYSRTSCLWTDDTIQFFANLGLQIFPLSNGYRSFSIFPFTEFLGQIEISSKEETHTSHPYSFDWTVCELASLCELSVERFVKDAAEVARMVFPSGKSSRRTKVLEEMLNQN